MHIAFKTYYLEPVQLKDRWKICDFIVANEDRLKRFFPKTLEQNLTPNLATLFVKKKIKAFQLNEEFLFTIKQQETNILLGLIYLKELDWTKKQGELAYCIGYPFEGKGITTKAIQTLAEYAFENFNIKTLQIIVHKDNIPSVKVAQNCNFTWIKTLKNAFAPPGDKHLNMELYELYHEME